MGKRVFDIFFKGDATDAVDAFKQVGDKAGEAEGKLGKIGTAAAGIGVAVGTGAVAAAGALFKLGSDFDSVYDGIQTTTGKTGKDLDALKDNFRNVVKDVPTDFASAGQAIGDLSAKTGLAGQPLEDMAKNVLNLSNITGTDLKANTEAAAKAMKDWNLPAGEAAGSLDVLFKASQNTGVNFTQLSTSMDKVGPTARGMGLTFNETAGLLSGLEKAGVDSEAVFKGLTKSLVAASDDVDKAHDAVGKAEKKLADAKAYAAAGHADGAAKVKAAQADLTASQDALAAAEAKASAGAAGMRADLEKNATAIKNAKTDQEALSLATEVFGKKAGPEMADALRTGKVSIDELVSGVQGASGAIGQTAKDTADGQERMQLAFNRAKIALEPLATKMFEFGAQLAEKVAPVIETVATWIADKLVPAVEDAAKWVGDNVVPAVQDLAMWLGDNLGPVIQDIAAWFRDDFLPAAQAVGDFIGDVLNGIIETAIGVWERFGTDVVAYVTTAFDQIKILVDTVVGVFTGLIDFVKGVFTGDWGAAWDRLKTAFSAIWDGMIDYVANVATRILPALLGITTAFLEWAGGLVGKVLTAIGDVTASLLQKGKDLLDGLWDGAKDIFGQVIAWHIALPKALFDAIGDVTKTLLSRGKDLLTGLWDGAKEVFATVLTWLGDIAEKAFAAVGNLARTLYESGKDLVEGFFDAVGDTWDRLKGFFSDVKNKVLGLIGSAAGWLTNTGGELIGGLVSAATAPFLAPSGAAYRFFADIPSKIASAVTGAASFVKDLGEDIINWMKSGMSGAWHFIVDYVVDKIKSLPGAVGGLIGGAIGAVNPFNADGGYFDRATSGIFGEAGPEVILPLTRPARLRQLLAMPEVAGPVAAAFGGSTRRGYVGATAAGGGPSFVIENLHVHGSVLTERDIAVGVIEEATRLQRQGYSVPWAS